MIKYYPKPKIEPCIVDYSGIQRCGKSTMLVKDLFQLKLAMPERKTYVNFALEMPDCLCMANEQMLEFLITAMERKIRDINVGVDELSQILTGRGYAKERQTRIASSLWQMPKRGWFFLYTSNVGASVDLIIREATTYTVLPKYIFGENGNREKDKIDYWAVSNYEQGLEKGIEYNVAYYQRFFDTWQCIE